MDSDPKEIKRDSKGRIVPGSGALNPGGKPAGVPSSGKLLRDALVAALTPDAAERISVKMIQQAERGDRFAREHLYKLHSMFSDNLHLSGAASILWNWQPPGEEPAQPAESGLPGAEAETDSEQG